MERGKRIARTFLGTFVILLVLCVLVRWIVGPGEPGVMAIGENGGPAIPPGISDSLWAIMATFLSLVALGVALMVSGGQLALRAVGSALLGIALAMAVMYAIEVTAFPWNTYEVTWGHIVDFWGIFFGGFAAVISSALTFAILNRRDRRASRWGRVIAGLSLGALSAVTWWWIAMWGFFSPFTLEGMWIYPLAIVNAVGAIALLRRRRRGSWDQPLHS